MYKKLSYLLAIAAVLAFPACNDMVDDVYDELDMLAQPYNKAISYTLQTADYTEISTAALKDATTDAEKALANAVKSTNSLNSFATADKYVPAILAKAFPVLNKNSTCQVSYAYTEDYLATLAGAPTYTLTAADYQLVWGPDSSTGYLTPSTSPAAKLPGILAADFPGATAGEVKLVSYKYADQEPGPSPTRLTEDFNGYTPVTSSPYTKWDQNGWTQVITVGGGTKYWRVRTRTSSGVTTFYSEISANGGAVEATETYVISPLVDLTQTTANEFSFNLCVGYWTADCLKVLITTDANALTTPATVTWTDVSANFTIPSTPTNTYGPFVTAGTMDLDAAFAGKKIYIAFKYSGEYIANADPGNRTTTYQLDDILVKGTAPGGGAEVTPLVENAIYTYGGTAWSAYPDALILDPADYTAMGVSTLSASTAPNYLPTYLKRQIAYPLTDMKRAVVYKTSSTANAADEYVFIGAPETGYWQPSLKGALKTEQFVQNGTKWIFDPTINATMVNADYQIVVTAVLSDPATSMYTRGTYTNEEWYYGFSAYYGNVNFRLSGSATSSRDVPSSLANDTELHSLSTNEEKNALLWQRLTEKAIITYLQLKYPDSPAMVQGVQLYYNISLKVYYPDGVTNTTYVYVLTYKVLTPGTSGTAPTFEYVGKKNLTVPDSPI